MGHAKKLKQKQFNMTSLSNHKDMLEALPTVIKVIDNDAVPVSPEG